MWPDLRETLNYWRESSGKILIRKTNEGCAHVPQLHFVPDRGKLGTVGHNPIFIFISFWVSSFAYFVYFIVLIIHFLIQGNFQCVKSKKRPAAMGTPLSQVVVTSVASIIEGAGQYHRNQTFVSLFQEVLFHPSFSSSSFFWIFEFLKKGLLFHTASQYSIAAIWMH